MGDGLLLCTFFRTWVGAERGGWVSRVLIAGKFTNNADSLIYLRSQLQMVLHIEKRKKKDRKRKKYTSKAAKSVNLQFLHVLIYFLM